MGLVSTLWPSLLSWHSPLQRLSWPSRMLFGGNPQEVGELRVWGKFRVSLVSPDLVNGDGNSLGGLRIIPSSKNLS